MKDSTLNGSKKLSIILLSYYSESRLKDAYQKIEEKMNFEKIDFELIIIDDGSKDNSFNIALELENKHSKVKAYQLSRNFTTHYAKFAGFSKCTGNCVVSVPDDLQLPLSVIVDMYRSWEKGAKIVIPHRATRTDSIKEKFFSELYYKIMNSISAVKFPPGGADGFLADREIIDILNNQIRPTNTSTIVEVLRLGFDPVLIPYERVKSKNKSRWTFRKKLKLFKESFLSASTWPIKMITFTGIASFLMSLLVMLTVVFLKFQNISSMGGVKVPGWASILVIVSMFSGLILLSLGIIAEYIWQIYEEVKDRPAYIIKNKAND